MKKILLAIAFVGFAAFNSFAQTKDGGKFSIGVDAGIPVGDASDGYSVALGGSLKYEHPVAPQTFLSLSAGYTDLLLKSDVKDALRAFGISRTGVGYIPVKVGVKYYINQGFYGEGQVGAAFSTESNGGTAFAYAPGIGYSFNGGLEAGIRYEAWSHDGTFGQFALRVAYRF